MKKVICDICGTAYPETATQCPICGSAKQIDSNAVTDTAAANAAKAPTKGGHFSNANVKKRNKANRAAKRPEQQSGDDNNDVQTKNGTVVVVWVLLVAVVMVLAYIFIQFVLPMIKQGKPDTTTGAPDAGTTAINHAAENTTAAPAGVPCTDIVIDGSELISFDAVGRAWLIEAKAQPDDTTDVIFYTSSDESVATVDAQGRVTAVGTGNAIITISCGNVSKQCTVVCDTGAEETTAEQTVPEETPADTTAPAESTEPSTAPSETTETPSETTTEPPATTEPPQETTPPAEEDFGLFRGEFSDDDITLISKGESFEFVSRKGTSLSDITWKSENPAIATVENGKVTAIAPGKTVIFGTFNGETDSCIIRCVFEGESPEEPDDSADDHPEWPHLYPAEDVSIRLNESFELSYVNADGEIVDIEWYSDNGDIASVSGDTVTGVGYGVTGIHGVYDGESISCIVRVLE